MVFERWTLLEVEILPFNPEFVDVDGPHFSLITREMGRAPSRVEMRVIGWATHQFHNKLR